jgi:hemolysin D
MSAASNAKQAPLPKPSPRMRLTRVDREFLPAALEILETPPSPVRMGLILLICALVVSAIAWAFIGRIDVIAIAQGKIQSVGRVKLVQPVETGNVRAIFVKNGTHVMEGEVVVELDDGEARAEEAVLKTTVGHFWGEALRRSAAIQAAKSGSFSPPSIDWPNEIPANVQTREEHALAGDLAQLSSTLDSLFAQRDQKQAERTHLVATIASQEQLLAISNQRVELRTTLEKEKLGTMVTLLDAKESLQQQRTSLTQLNGQLAAAIAAIVVFERDAAKAVDTFIAENGQKLVDAERQGEENNQRLVKARARNTHMTLRAPVSGVVQALTITSTGQVVMPGEEVMRVVPDDGGFEIECYMPNKDIGFVSTGQEAVVKIESYPFTRYGSLSARVMRVGTDAIAEPDAAQQEVNPGKSHQSTFLGGAQRTQNLYFPVTLTPDRTTIGDNGALRISNGMAVTVEVKTGERRIIDYLFSPLVEIGSRALKER